MKKLAAGLLIGLTLLSGTARAAGPVLVDGTPVDASARVYNNTTYVSLRTISEALYPDGTVSWEDGQAVVRTALGTLTARPGDCYIAADGRYYPATDGVRLESGYTLVPVRALAAALGAIVEWEADSGTVHVVSAGTASSGESYADQLYWLSRIISAESQGEPMDGKIAVGNVVLNRVAHSDFPDTVYDVIFDNRWGGQFEPVRNGTIYHTPTEESIQAARLCLEGASTAGGSLYFLAPSLASNLWTTDNRTLVTVIGSHWFYQ